MISALSNRMIAIGHSYKSLLLKNNGNKIPSVFEFEFEIRFFYNILILSIVAFHPNDSIVQWKTALEISEAGYKLYSVVTCHKAENS